MVVFAYQIIASCLAIVVLSFTWKLLNWAYLRPKKLERILREQGFKGNSYKLIYGDFKEMSETMQDATSKPINFGDDIRPRVFPFVFKTLQKYGNESFFWMGATPMVIITEVELIKQVFAKYLVYQKLSSPNPMTKLLGRGLLMFEKEKWAKQRKMYSPAFHLDKLKLMVPAFYLSCDEVLKKWEEILVAEGWCEVDVLPYLKRLTSDALSRTAFGSSYEEGRRVFELQMEQAAHAIKASMSIYIPGSRFLPTKRYNRMKEIDREVQSIIRSLINKRIKAMEAGEATSSEDFLGILLEPSYTENEQSGSQSSGMSIDEVVEECKLIYLGGQVTTSSMLAWTLILLSRYPDWQTKAREEVLRVFGNQKPYFDALSHLKILGMILHEVLRMYPPAVSIDRLVAEHTKLGRYVLPAGVGISLPIILLHHDREIWGDDALEFNPQRFSEGVSKAQRRQGAYFPFGLGPRICIGQNFAMAEAKVAVAMMLQRFSFELSPSYTHAPISAVTTQPQHGAHLVLHKL